MTQAHPHPHPLSLATDTRGVATLTLARPEKHNALAPDLIDALHAAAVDLASDPAVRVVVLTGAGASFCAGGDLGWMAAQRDAPRARRLSEARRLAAMLGALNALPKPLIGRVNGPAYGGGVGLACVCDVVLAAETARFGLTEARLGLIPATIAPYVAARIGERGLRAVALSGRVFAAEEAVALGIVHRALPAEHLDAAVEAEAAACLAAAPGAVAAVKALARALGPRIDEAVIEESIARLADVWETAEAGEGVAAFFARRPPPWA
jgi:methylglutaconyl-CoA hydratase